MIISCNSIKKSYGLTTILNNISFNINEMEKVAIVGVNGAGKSTLFKIICGEISQDEGNVNIPKTTNIGYFSQSLDINEENTIFEEMLFVFEDIIIIENKLRKLENDMSKFSGQALENLIKEYDLTSENVDKDRLFNYNSKIKGVLRGLGFKEEDFNKNISSFSGGQKTRIALGKILLKEPNLLLLDEPTNHLDISSIQWLETFLKSYKGSILIISHDRYFLNKIVNKIIEIENKKSTIYLGNYSDYYDKKKILRETMLKQYLDQQKEIAKTEESIKKLRSFNREKSIKRAESKEKQLEKINIIEKPENLPDKMRLKLTPKKESGNDVLSIKTLKKTFEHTIFENISFEIKKGEKVALIGKNGIGKTTLIRIIMNKLQYESGDLKLGSNVIIAYYAQEQENLNLEKTIFEEISDTYPNLTNMEIRNTLAFFMFTNDNVFKKISTLSGGEKGRISLAKIMLSNANFLILDEPTNHLDTNSKEILENAINNYEGTCLYISHDRFFINNTATKVIELTKNKVNTYLGNYDYYLEKIQNSSQSNEIKAEINTSETKLNWKIQKEQQAELRKKENTIKKLETEIEETEEKLKKLDGLLATEKVYTSPSKSKEVFEEKLILEESLIKLYEKWENFSI